MSFLQKFQEYFELTDAEAQKFLQNAPRYYKKHEISKRTGGKREIHQPTKSLKIVQKWAIKECFHTIFAHNSAMAYSKGKNILKNATPHANNRFLLKLDFEDFFYSIKDSDLQLFFNAHQIYENDEESQRFLIRVLMCQLKNKESLRLSIGAPSSPFVSNVIMHLFDEQISELCDKKNIQYTRYADDLFFSTNEKYVLTALPKTIKDILNRLDYPTNLVLNSSKTVQTSKKFNRTVTGLTLSNDASISIGRAKKRHWRMKAYNLAKKLESLDRNDLPVEIIEEINSLRGYIAFLSGIDKKFAESLKKISSI